MDLEAIVLTGGRSRRMGQDKAALEVGGVPMGERIAAELQKVASPVIAVGLDAIPGFEFIEDQEPHAGPLAALAQYAPSSYLVFVCACDFPYFEASVVTDLAAKIGSAEAALPVVDGEVQPLCGIYRRSAFRLLREMVDAGERLVATWVDSLDVVRVEATELTNPEAVRSANTPEELQSILAGRTPHQAG